MAGGNREHCGLLHVALLLTYQKSEGRLRSERVAKAGPPPRSGVEGCSEYPLAGEERHGMVGMGVCDVTPALAVTGDRPGEAGGKSEIYLRGRGAAAHPSSQR